MKQDHLTRHLFKMVFGANDTEVFKLYLKNRLKVSLYLFNLYEARTYLNTTTMTSMTHMCSRKRNRVSDVFEWYYNYIVEDATSYKFLERALAAHIEPPKLSFHNLKNVLIGDAHIAAMIVLVCHGFELSNKESIKYKSDQTSKAKKACDKRVLFLCFFSFLFF